MLKEIKSVRQIPGEPLRHWYKDNESDLIVWVDQYRVVGFQLIVPAADNRHVVTWHEGKGPTVAELDEGEDRPGRPKMTPVLIDVRAVDAMEMSRHFKAISQELPAGLAELIEHKIAEMK